jgi:DHA1 family multidrug resistance protein-like MFS transporter
MTLESWKGNLAAIFVAQFCVMVAFSFIFPFTPLYVHDLGVQDATRAAQWSGAIGASAAFSMALAQPFWGSLADRVGRRPMVIRSMVAAAVTLGLMGLAQTPWHLLALRCLQGVFSGTVTASNTLVATSVPKDRLGQALGIMQVAFFGGTSMGPLVGGYVADRWGFRAACVVAAVLAMAAATLVTLVVRESFTPPPRGERPSGVVAESRAVLAVPGFTTVILVVFLVHLGPTLAAPVLALFIRDLTGGTDTATTAGAMFAATGVVSAVAAVVGGRLGDRWGHGVILPVCLLGAAVTYAPQAYVRTVGELLALRLVLGVFLGGLMPSANALLARLVPAERRGSGFALGATATSLANGVGPLGGALAATHLGIREVFLVAGVLYAVGHVTVLVALRRLPRHLTGPSTTPSDLVPTPVPPP